MADQTPEQVTPQDPNVQTTQAQTPAKPPVADDFEFDNEPEAPEAVDVPATAPPPAASPPPAVIPPEPPAKITHSRSITQTALDLGLAQEEIDWSTREQLDDAIYHRHRMRQEASPPSVRQAPAPEPEPPIDWGVDDEGKKLTDADFHPALVRQIKTQNKETHALKQALAEQQKAEKQRATLSFVERMDRCFAKNQTIFGKGEAAEINPQSAHAHRRLAVVDAMRRMTQGSTEERYERAVELLGFTQPPPAPTAPTVPTETQKEWIAGSVAKPTQRDGAPEPKGIAKAKKAFVEGAQKAGISLDWPDDDEEF